MPRTPPVEVVDHVHDDAVLHRVASDRFGRALLASLLLFPFAPLTLGWGGATDGSFDGTGVHGVGDGMPGDEVMIELVGGVAWTRPDWTIWEERGFSLLRQPSPAVVIAWLPEGVVGEGGLDAWTDDRVAIRPTGPAGFRGDGPGHGIRLVLEPRLADVVVDRVVDAVEASAGPIEWEWRPPAGSPLSATLLIEPSPHRSVIARLLDLPGVWWIEPLLPTGGRDSVAASLLQTGVDVVDGGEHPAWRLGLDGSGVTIGVADSGLDMDHACFRNATMAGALGSEGGNGSDAVAPPGLHHRKVALLNDTIDDWDDDQQDFGHGTHIAGILACRLVAEQRAEDPVLSLPSNISSLSHGARLLVQDVVAGEEWLEPTMDWLLAEAFSEQVVIHSDSWGDATEAYTQRSSDLDAWMVEVPWSLVFVAPGNSPSAFYEPANARNAIAVAASMRDGGSDLMASSATGPTEEGIRGMHVAAPGISILSAASDGERDSLNDGESRRTGTSFSTPMAASATAVIQQMVEDGWLRGAGENASSTPLSTLRPVWADASNDSANASLGLSTGFTPSGPLLKALLALSAEALDGGMHGATPLGAAPDAHQGWGRPSLERLVSFEALEAALGSGGTIDPSPFDPSPAVWLHDSFRMVDGSLDRGAWLQAGGSRPLESVVTHAWDGGGAEGPFLAGGVNASWEIDWDGASDVDVVLSYAPRPFGLASDDLDLVVELPDGRIALGNDLVDGWSRMRDSDSADGRDPLESTERVRIPAARLESVGSDGPMSITVVARSVGLGGSNGTIGLDGDRLGFALAASGVDRESAVSVAPETGEANESQNGTEGGAGSGGQNGTDDSTGNGTSGEGDGDLPPTLLLIEPGAGLPLAGETVVRWKAVDPEGEVMVATVRLMRWNGSEAIDSGIGCDDVETLSGITASCTIDVTALQNGSSGLWSIRIDLVAQEDVGEPSSFSFDSAHLTIGAPPPDCPLCGLSLSVPGEAVLFEEVAFDSDPSSTEGWAHWGGGEVRWDFGDGGSATGWSVRHAFDSDPGAGLSGGPDHRTVTICVSFTGGGVECEERQVRILVPAPEAPAVSASASVSALLPVVIVCAALPVLAYLLGRRRNPPSGAVGQDGVEPPFDHRDG